MYCWSHCGCGCFGREQHYCLCGRIRSFCCTESIIRPANGCSLQDEFFLSRDMKHQNSILSLKINCLMTISFDPRLRLTLQLPSIETLARWIRSRGQSDPRRPWGHFWMLATLWVRSYCSSRAHGGHNRPMLLGKQEQRAEAEAEAEQSSQSGGLIKSAVAKSLLQKCELKRREGEWIVERSKQQQQKTWSPFFRLDCWMR